MLFGRKVSFEDPVLGTFETRVRSENPSIERTWYGGNKLEGQQSETTFILEGNFNGPNKLDLESVKRIVSELSQIVSEIDTELSKKPQYSKISDWTKTFFLSAVMPYERGFEICFEPVNSDDIRTVNCFWVNGRISEIEGK